jgi:putative hydrolase
VDPADALDSIAFHLERTRAETYRIRAYRRAATALRAAGPDTVRDLADRNRLQELPNVGKTTAGLAEETLRSSGPPQLLQDLRAAAEPVATGGEALVAALRGDCHLHSDWSDGHTAPIVMARAARDEVLGGRGHEWAVLTDHSPRLTVANGLSPERLREQLGLVERINSELAPFRLLTGIEVDINEDGSLDQEPDLLARLDLVVGSVHSLLRSDSKTMTRRMVTAISNPHMDVLGHCTGRLVEGGRGVRPPSTFDAEVVFEACRRFDVAVEINARPERRDPPRDLLRLAVEMGCLFALDTDAHWPGQLDWQPYGAARATECGVDPARVITTWSLSDLQTWTGQKAPRG